jgi:hypothetical protein
VQKILMTAPISSFKISAPMEKGYEIYSFWWKMTQ